jgi:hypothetical protein
MVIENYVIKMINFTLTGILCICIEREREIDRDDLILVTAIISQI